MNALPIAVAAYKAGAVRLTGENNGGPARPAGAQTAAKPRFRLGQPQTAASPTGTEFPKQQIMPSGANDVLAAGAGRSWAEPPLGRSAADQGAEQGRDKRGRNFTPSIRARSPFGRGEARQLRDQTRRAGATHATASALVFRQLLLRRRRLLDSSVRDIDSPELTHRRARPGVADPAAPTAPLDEPGRSWVSTTLRAGRLLPVWTG